MPLLSAIAVLLLPRQAMRFAGVLASLLLGMAAIASTMILISRWGLPDVALSLHWFDVGTTPLSFSIYLTPVTLMMLALVPIVSTLVHVYSIGYMAGDESRRRYFAMLGFFTFAMLALVGSDNLLQTFFFWELVGIASYFLIGHWRSRPEAAQAATKAALMNRVGDTAMLIGIGLIWYRTGTLQFETLEAINLSDDVTWTVAGLCLLLGVAGKSAQLPLLTWLPDAMQGPTPVSALIHAATMVAAGVFLLARLHFIFTPEVMTVISTVGLATALFGAWHALRQFDIKKILAYSTISQLGLMVMAIGAGAWQGALLHLTTHAFFKASLFLGAGLVIHHLQHESKSGFDAQDIRNMGGLRAAMPYTFFAFAAASSALAGIPFFSGFVSKEAMLMQLVGFALNEPIRWVWVLAFFAISFLTVLYTFRFISAVFLGDSRSALPAHAPFSLTMTTPLMVLTAACGWWIIAVNPLDAHGWLANGLHLPPAATNWIVTGFSAGWVVLAAALAWRWFPPGSPSNQLSNPAMVDTWYGRLITQPVLYMSTQTYAFDKKAIDRFLHTVAYVQVTLAFIVGWLDRVFVDGLVVLIGKSARGSGLVLRALGGGDIQKYLLGTALALVIFLFWILN